MLWTGLLAAVPPVIVIAFGAAATGWIWALGWMFGWLVRELRAGRSPTWHGWSIFTAFCAGFGCLIGVIAGLRSLDGMLIHMSNLAGLALFILPVFVTVCHRMVPFFAGNVVKGYLPWRPFWVLAAFWIAILLFGAPTGSIPAPVPEGLAFLYADRVEYRQTSPLVQYGIPLYVASAVVLIGLWIRRVYAATPEGDLKRRFQWIFLCGIFFAAPAGIFEITEWLGAHSGVTGWNWLLAMTALAYQHVLKVDRIAGPAQVVRAAFSRILPESLFRKFDHRYFPKEAAIEDNLRAVASELDACNQLDRLDSILTHGLEQAVGAPGIDLSEERETTDTLPLAPKHNGPSLISSSPRNASAKKRNPSHPPPAACSI
jgi:hypothetical protein